MNSNFKANITFLGSDQGGRFSEPANNYGPQIKAGDVFTSCTIHGHDIDFFKFNQVYEVEISLRFPNEYGNCFSEGIKIELYEGSKMTGVGQITQMNPHIP